MTTELLYSIYNYNNIPSTTNTYFSCTTTYYFMFIFISISFLPSRIRTEGLISASKQGRHRGNWLCGGWWLCWQAPAVANDCVAQLAARVQADHCTALQEGAAGPAVSSLFPSMRFSWEIKVTDGKSILSGYQRNVASVRLVCWVVTKSAVDCSQWTRCSAMEWQGLTTSARRRSSRRSGTRTCAFYR